ncbi:hypothetical protein TNCV_674351 [Trichonephila clavipes]|nr:hypothetical protein TNCV_674351 [Trichonephila clavipes]
MDCHCCGDTVPDIFTVFGVFRFTVLDVIKRQKYAGLITVQNTQKNCGTNPIHTTEKIRQKFAEAFGWNINTITALPEL